MAEAATEAAPEANALEQFMALADADGGLDDGPAIIAKQEEPAAKPAAIKPTIADAVDPNDPTKDAEKTKAKPEPGDWAAIRKERREHNAAIERDRAAVAAERAGVEAAKKAVEHIAPERLQELLDSGDLDEFAKRISAGKFKDWNAINDYAARRFASPEAQHNRKLADEVAALKAERAEEKRQQELQAQEFERQRAEREFISFVDAECKGATDPVVKALAQSPEFTQAVYGHLAQHYRATGEQMDVAEAAEVIAAGARRRYAEWHTVFGIQPTDNQAEAAQAATPDRAGSKQPAKPTKHVARNRAAEAATQSRELTHQEQIALGKAELEKALAEDLKNGTFG